MKNVGIFEAKTRLAEICAQVAATGESVTVTRRGEPLVVIAPVRRSSGNILERRAAYFKRYGAEERSTPEADFELEPRVPEIQDFTLG